MEAPVSDSSDTDQYSKFLTLLGLYNACSNRDIFDVRPEWRPMNSESEALKVYIVVECEVS